MSDEEIDERLIAILRSLLRRTRHRKIDWTPGEAAGSEAFYYHLPTSSLEIRSKKGDGNPPYILSVRDSFGSKLDELATDPWGEHSYNEELAELFRLARRQSLMVDETLDQLLADLRKEESEEG
ncbi:hypothetical protein [Lentzea sp. CC55]|uniref:hypothetical protein n=1 Tax=Lentzea sp. CC55 TaxID=2884909 RepID=UPI001F1718E7|nr:hypothetical protein [Lentzea sp. CC55]MCG8921288.1 hypothetical protein [Lentzea sp. CC55]